VNEFGFKSLRIVQWLWNLTTTHAYYYPLFVECVNLNIPVCLQVGHTGPLMPSEVGRPIPYIDQIALDFPELKIVCGHIGYPWTTEMIAVTTKHENVFKNTIFSCTSCTTNNISPIIEILGRRIGVKKAIMTTVHANTSSNTIVDAQHKKTRMGRAGFNNLIHLESTASWNGKAYNINP